MNRAIKLLLAAFSVIFMTASCMKPDSEKPWGFSLIYMPQANNNPYVVPNTGTRGNMNVNYIFNEDAGVVEILLGVYRSGLAELEAYSVSVSVGSEPAEGSELLTEGYSIPSSVTCPNGKRDQSFSLSVDLDFLESNAGKTFSLPVSISAPTRYELNESLATTMVVIHVGELLSKRTL